MKHHLPLIPLMILLIPTEHVVAQSTLTRDSILIDGNYRTFHFHKPLSTNSNTSLVFVMHGSGGDGIGIAQQTAKLEAIASKENFIAVYPDGYKRFWNECRKTASSEANIVNIDEVSFFQAMINYFKKSYHINDRRVFAVGTSGGGHMAYKLAMLMPDKFRAITAIIANLPDEPNMDCAGRNVPIAVMIVNSTTDPVNPYNGGEVRTGNFKAGTVRSTDETFHYWANVAGYNGEPVRTALPDTDANDGKTIERYTYRAKNKPEVVLLKVIGGKHDYPTDIDVHVEAWEFFKRQL
jgi:polyhydroxybutyrate depolymerase